MKKLLLIATGCVFLSAPAFSMTDEECTTMWKQADANSNGTLDGAEADRYAAWMRTKDRSLPGDGVINETNFQENCKADVFTTAAVDEGAPLEGANSFTEEQARDRAVSSGFSDVSALTKDDKGIWRGTATKDGKAGNVAIDYKGNVVGG
ncbi:MAG: hypothetical protein H0T51_12655 [Pirellulales bacterium]|nr:hypothetical protein [Pirellulales bacterium]